MKSAQEEQVLRRRFGLFSAKLSMKQHIAERRALRWFVHRQSGAFDKSRQDSFERWVERDEAHLEAYQRHIEFWRLLGSFSERSAVRSFNSFGKLNL